MNIVPHLIRLEGSSDLLLQVIVRGDFAKRERPRGSAQAGKVFLESEDAAMIDAQAFPHRVAALDG